MTTDIKVGSVTNAQRAQRLLRTFGIKSDIKKHLRTTPSDGCGYVVRVYSQPETAINILNKNGITASEVEP